MSASISQTDDFFPPFLLSFPPLYPLHPPLGALALLPPSSLFLSVPLCVPRPVLKSILARYHIINLPSQGPNLKLQGHTHLHSANLTATALPTHLPRGLLRPGDGAPSVSPDSSVLPPTRVSELRWRSRTNTTPVSQFRFLTALAWHLPVSLSFLRVLACLYMRTNAHNVIPSGCKSRF